MGKEERVGCGVGKVTKVMNRSRLWSGNRSKAHDRSVQVCLTDDRSRRVWMTGDRSFDHVTRQRNE